MGFAPFAKSAIGDPILRFTYLLCLHYDEPCDIFKDERLLIRLHLAKVSEAATAKANTKYNF